VRLSFVVWFVFTFIILATLYASNMHSNFFFLRPLVHLFGISWGHDVAAELKTGIYFVWCLKVVANSIYVTSNFYLNSTWIALSYVAFEWPNNHR
jgi:hypothetical protein